MKEAAITPVPSWVHPRHDYRDCIRFNGGCCSLRSHDSGKLCTELQWNLAVTVFKTAELFHYCKKWKKK